MKEDFSFMKESIKDKPFYKKKWVQILCKTIVLAVLFGLISATVFMKIYRQMEKKQMLESMQEIEIPKDQPEEIEPVEATDPLNEEPETVFVEAELTLKEYTESIGINAIFHEDYGLREFCKNVVGDLDNRCVNYCYKVRLEETAKYAKENGYDTITTTLLVSPYQDHELIKQLGEQIAEKYGLTFLYRDFRIGFREGQSKARELGLYMQKYCGCVFSEEDRYYRYKK